MAMSAATCSKVSIGVLSLQGSFSEHVDMLKRVQGVRAVVEVRLPEDLDGLDGLIFPGGESTTMAIIGESSGIFSALKKWTVRFVDPPS
jgi:pyridoxal 5'-phosphate synthase pdxT subunit